jgi:hypothetical protein
VGAGTTYFRGLISALHNEDSLKCLKNRKSPLLHGLTALLVNANTAAPCG